MRAATILVVIACTGCYSKPSRLPFRNLYVQPLKAPKLNPTPHIINGREATPHSFPYQAFVLLTGGDAWFCGGSLISRNWVLTAGHCGKGATVAHITLGAHNPFIEEDTQLEIQSSSILVHPRYNSDILENDLTLIKLSQSAPLSNNIQPVKVPKLSDASNSYAGRIGIASGWGVTLSGSLSDVLEYAELNIISPEECATMLDNIEPSKICTSGANGAGVCGGDSGGPLVVDGVIVGVTSFSVNDCDPGVPNGFARVTNALLWIASNTDVDLT